MSPRGGSGRSSFLRRTASPSLPVHALPDRPPPGDERPGTHAGDVTEGALPLGDDPLAALHREHYVALVRLAVLVVGDAGIAEQVVQDAFVKLQLRWGGLRQVDRAPAWLRSAVLNGARSHLRRRRVQDRHAARRVVAPSMPTPETAAVQSADHERIVAALRRLPTRQREAVVLRYFADLPEADIAAAMGVSAGSVKTHLHRGLAALAAQLGEADTTDSADDADHDLGHHDLGDDDLGDDDLREDDR